ncbi:nitrate- and nitrite sensing domain-containing protein [Shimia sp. R11_0]|uniref:methyl-accepting chemotaxis protein n=1 Tax=Shimia sp. R11_0 TaxID=2821096 RepID=UPI001ADBCFE3|nr:methyl-accepting chemotaxis protein [Shimia sp. R11_0]MBO9478745.1 nitrate- and nitrite sensing domain-containing protein [Shimia sp. R11_0]
MKLRLVMLLVIGPLFTVAGSFMYHDVSHEKKAVARAHATTLQAQEGAIVGAVIHELQKERGYSAGYLSSGGVNFSYELAQQRKNTEATIEVYGNSVEELHVKYPEAFKKIEDELGRLPEIRASVDGFQITVPQMAKFYTATINDMLDISRPTGIAGHDSRLISLLAARAMVGAAKENAGLERAMGATGLGAGFSLALHDRFVSLGGAQKALLKETSGALPGEGWLSELHATPEFAAMQQARETVSQGYADGDFKGLTAPEWFKISTNWINLLRDRELSFIAEVDALTHTIEAEAQRAFTQLAWIGAIATLLMLVFAIVSFERMIARIKYLISVIQKFTEGDFNVFVEGIDGKDELSRMANAVYHFKQDSIQMRNDAEALKEAQERIKQDQDFVVMEIRQGLSKLADGDLTQRFDASFPEEYEGLRHDFNTAALKLNDTLVSFAQTTNNVRNSTVTFSKSSEDLSQRTESQAKTLEQTAAALKDITGSVQTAANGARNVQKTTETAKKEATDSGDIVRAAVDAMADISSSSNEIGQIVSVIEDIAFQTNLLALNAGVEAARAGEAGSGFAVVASEVRALAQKSSDAAREIQDLVGESTKSVNTGVDLVHKTGAALESIVQRVTHISDLVAEMAEGTAEQAAGLGDINNGVSRIEEVTQHNATMAQDVNRTSATLRGQADELEGMVAQFSLTHPTEQSAASAA